MSASVFWFPSQSLSSAVTLEHKWLIRSGLAFLTHLLSIRHVSALLDTLAATTNSLTCKAAWRVLTSVKLAEYHHLACNSSASIGLAVVACVFLDVCMLYLLWI